MSNQTKVEAGMSTYYWPRALVYSVWTKGNFTKHTLNDCKKGYSRNCDSKEDTMIRRETRTQFWIFLPSMPRTVFLILSPTARQTLCLAAAAWGPELWSASYGISVIKRLERGWERSPRVLRLTSSFISILSVCTVAGGISRLRVIIPAFPFSCRCETARRPAPASPASPRSWETKTSTVRSSSPASVGRYSMRGKERGGVKMSDLYEEFLSFVASF